MAKGKGRGSRGLISWILIVICAIVFCGSAAHLLLYAKDKLDAEKDFSQIRDHSRDLSEIYELNHDFIGWIKIEDTKINYPVMQTPDDPEYYLHRDFSGEYSASGVPFLDGVSVVKPRDAVIDGEEYHLDTTWNWLIYGHNMKFGTMFHDLQEYDSKEFWEDHKTFTFDVYDPETGKTDSGVYEIFAASRSQIRAEDSAAFQYYQYAGLSDEETFYEYVNGVMAESSYDTGIEPQFGDQLVTLSTCAYHTNEGRMYIVGRRIK
ncbi:MAG: class B sortase [Clostridiales bacterium]|nr:class B sortase [Clostridiales bacterium]